MSFELPQPGTPAMVDLICRLNQARYENARAWIIVTIDDESGEIIHGHGPFPEAEQALVAAGEQHLEWERMRDPDGGTETYKIVPLWGPGE